ncbi:hypothetical protein BDV93DRAFT_562955 [Ceratobasidium sp. AG-I]|nr:hypothetical protein BDV93DRAFT_562955 [Ceratobasidium sp. AG-I]
MSVTCLCHDLHLVCRAILNSLGAMISMEDNEAYAMAKLFEENQLFEKSAKIAKEEEWLKAEASDENALAPKDASDNNPSNTEDTLAAITDAACDIF